MKLCCDEPICLNILKYKEYSRITAKTKHKPQCNCGTFCAFCRHYPAVLKFYREFIWVKT